MKKLIIFVIFVMWTHSNHTVFTIEKVKKELQKMVNKDQKLRKKAIAHAQQTSRSLNDVMKELKVDELNVQHCLTLGNIIQLIRGWPRLSHLGQKACQNAWILVQHSTNINFQKKCLTLMLQLPEHEIELCWIAYLYDRIQINENKPQRYGTQINHETGVPFALEDPEHIDELRLAMELEPLADYLNSNKEIYEKYKNWETDSQLN